MAKKRTLQGALKAAVRQQKQNQKAQKRNAAAAAGTSNGPPSKKQKLNNPSQPQPQPQQKKKHIQLSHLRPVIPFSPADQILLIGEADLSFAASLATHHKCRQVTATVLEPSLSALKEKYPHVEANISSLLSTPPDNNSNSNKLLYSIDARKLKFPPTFDRIMFNFPHVGGKSTDVNRQVRYNQEMLVDFFRSAKRCLSPSRGSSIVVTLFEGEPYTLWNIKDLGRHSGLEVERSFAFRGPEAYPGYRHARTLGVVKKRDGTESKSAWKGEERRARSFVFVRKGECQVMGKGKRKGEEDSEESQESQEEEGDDDGDGNGDDDGDGNGDDEDGGEWDGFGDEDEKDGEGRDDQGEDQKEDEAKDEGEKEGESADEDEKPSKNGD
ncbi:hypothetical protein QBC42DRAFT_234056 [Cladorrhinum samala]|uniref:25S rRNA (uridine-N(3))-methyltransferase BMT5-like domain-containing protein n=1 Tax=Cladorrhinum samala TaxID=585594 RepID=A0AAV9HCW6_9PEZI|nr:hypothetical protein QBC42DRAFT_234056 [Cladorrhinum samala]